MSAESLKPWATNVAPTNETVTRPSDLTKGESAGAVTDNEKVTSASSESAVTRAPTTVIVPAPLTSFTSTDKRCRSACHEDSCLSTAPLSVDELMFLSLLNKADYIGRPIAWEDFGVTVLRIASQSDWDSSRIPTMLRRIIAAVEQRAEHITQESADTHDK